MREIKFRQRLKPNLVRLCGDPYHYWGYIDNSFISPLGKNDVVGDSEQYTVLKDNSGNPIYQNDNILYCGDICRVEWYESDASFLAIMVEIGQCYGSGLDFDNNCDIILDENN